MSENGMTMGDRSDTSDLDEMLGAYALDAVSAEERRRVDDYLRSNPKAAAEVREHREVASMLAFTGMDAPADIWSKIAVEIEADAPAPGPELAKVLALDSSESRSARRRVGTWALGAAAAVALGVAGAVVVIGTDDTASNDPIAAAYDRAIDDADSVQAELVADGSPAAAVGVIDQEGHGYLDAGDLPRLGPEQTYQLWGVLEANGDVVSLGILGRRPELETFTVEVGVAALAITIEQSPGVISDGNPDGAFVGELTPRV